MLQADCPKFDSCAPASSHNRHATASGALPCERWASGVCDSIGFVGDVGHHSMLTGAAIGARHSMLTGAAVGARHIDLLHGAAETSSEARAASSHAVQPSA
jgi:hypothetical protein